MLDFYYAKEGPMWTLETPWYELFIRGTCIFFFMLIIMKVWGKKHLGEMAAFDFILLLFISEAVQNSLVDDDKSIFGGMIVIATFLFWNSLLNKLTYRFRKLEKIIDGVPKILIKNGIVDEKALREEQITEQELFEAMRKEGIDELKKVKKATIETNGHLSVIEQ
jgi:uncharacterized membrane protein YcaP (DUF421 family)